MLLGCENQQFSLTGPKQNGPQTTNGSAALGCVKISLRARYNTQLTELREATGGDVGWVINDLYR